MHVAWRRLGGPPRNYLRRPQPRVAQSPMEWLGLGRRELVEMALLEAEQVLMAVLRLEEGAGQVVKKLPPSSSLQRGHLR